MQDPNRSIYRTKALLHHRISQDRAILPRFLTYSTGISKFLIAFLIVPNLWFMWYAKIPLYIKGSAIIINAPPASAQRESSTIVIVFSPEYLNSVHTGDPLFLQSGSAGDRMQSSITHVETQISDRAALQQRFHLNSSVVLAMPNPAAVAIAPLSASADSAPPSADGGALYHVDIAVGSRRIGSFVPFIGQWLDDSP